MVDLSCEKSTWTFKSGTSKVRWKEKKTQKKDQKKKKRLLNKKTDVYAEGVNMKEWLYEGR